MRVCTLVYVWVVPLAPFFATLTYLGFHTYAYVAGVVWGVGVLNILVRHTTVSPWSVAIPYPLLFSPMFLLDLFSVFLHLVGASCLWTMRIRAWFVYVCMLFYVCGCLVVPSCVWRCPFCALLHNILGFFTYAHVPGDAWARNIPVCHTFVSPWSVAVGVWSFVVRVWWCFVVSLFLVLCLSLCFVSPPLFSLTRTSRLAPMARTLLCVLTCQPMSLWVDMAFLGMGKVRRQWKPCRC